METLGLTEAALWDVELAYLTPTFVVHRPCSSFLRRLVQQRSPQFLGAVIGALITIFSPICQPFFMEMGILQEAIAATTNCTTTTVLRRGDRGSAVTQLQQALAAQKYKITVDGIFGDQTEIILKLFQRSNKLDVDGIYGVQTCNALAKLSRSTASPATPSSQPSASTSNQSGSQTSSSASNPGRSTGSNQASNQTNNPPEINDQDGLLEAGETGKAVLQLQQQLRQQGYNIDLTGKYDTATENAVRDFQRKRGLTSDGIVGSQTQAALNGQAIAQTPAPPQTATPHYPYTVVVPSRSATTLAEVQRFVPKAQLHQSRLGLFVHAGSYQNREYAESISYNLRSRGLDARVIKE